jgi:hypothetical protein
MCGCFSNTYVYLYLPCSVLFGLCIFILICFVCTGVRTAVLSGNSIAVNNNNNNYYYYYYYYYYYVQQGK